MHWIADAQGCDRSRVSLASIQRALIELPEALGLTPIGKPQVFEHRATLDESSTIAGIVLIAESHVSIHGFPGEGAIHADIFSCKGLARDVAREFVKTFFAAREVTDQVFGRGQTVGEPPSPVVDWRRAR